MDDEERRRDKAEYMRRWRAENPARSREIQREFFDRWRAEHPDEPRTYWKQWRDEHPEEMEAARQKGREYNSTVRRRDPKKLAIQRRAMWEKWQGIREAEFHTLFGEAHPNAIWMDRIRPDFYVPGEGFVEIKRALPQKIYGWRLTSIHFPGLYFQYHGSYGKPGSSTERSIDDQFALMPRPLVVIVYNAMTGDEIARKSFHDV